MEDRGKSRVKGLALSRAFYEEFGAPMIREQFPEYEGRIAAGLAGPGSECFGFDDGVSEDHDFEAGFCLWLTEEDMDAVGFPLSRAYRKLPDSFWGVRKQAQSYFGGNRRGVLEIGEFYSRFLGSPGVPEDWRQWMAIPEYALAEAVNGQVFRDDLGEFSRIRKTLLAGYPEDVRRKKIAARAALMAQSGQYNFSRCLRHGEPGAAGLALAEFVRASGSMAYLLNNRYAPYYKWLLRGMRGLPILSDLAGPLEALAAGELRAGRQAEETVERVCAQVAEELRRQGLSPGHWDYLEPHAMAVMERIRNGEIRNLHVMEG